MKVTVIYIHMNIYKGIFLSVSIYNIYLNMYKYQCVCIYIYINSYIPLYIIPVVYTHNVSLRSGKRLKP